MRLIGPPLTLSTYNEGAGLLAENGSQRPNGVFFASKIVFTSTPISAKARATRVRF